MGVGGNRGIAPVRALLQATAFCRGSHRHLAIEGGQAVKWSRGSHIQQESNGCRNRKNMMINLLFQCRKSCWIEQPGKAETYFCNETCPWKGGTGYWVIIWYVLFWGRGLILQTETALKDYCATSRPSVHNCIRHDNVLFFTAINTMAPVGLLLCIVCLDLPGKQAVEETAISLRQKCWF